MAGGLAATGTAIALGGYLTTGWEARSAFQITLGLLIAACSLFTLLRSKPTLVEVTEQGGAQLKLRAEPRFRRSPETVLPIVFWCVMAGYILLVQETNFAIGSFVFGGVYLWSLFRFGIVKAVVVSALVTGATYGLFVAVLGVPFS
jgi:hypothetical protein